MSEVIKDGYARVSDIASCFAPYGKIPKETLDNAAERGDKVHDIIYDILNDVPVPKDDFDWKGKEAALQGYIDSFNEFWDTLERPIILMQEDRLYDDGLMITGKMDLLISNNDEIILLDWKTSSSPSIHWDIQAGGYLYLLKNGYSEEDPHWRPPSRIDKIFFMHLKKNGKKAESIDLLDHMETFLMAHEMYKKYFRNVTFNLEDL